MGCTLSYHVIPCQLKPSHELSKLVAYTQFTYQGLFSPSTSGTCGSGNCRLMRSPFHRAHKGELSENTSDEMLSQVIKALRERNLFDTSEIDDIIVGCAYRRASKVTT